MARRAIVRIAALRNLTVVESEADLVDASGSLIIVTGADETNSGPRVTAWRERFPSSILVAFVDRPDQAIWMLAERAGFDLVTSKGAIGPSLRKLTAGSLSELAERAIAACDSSEIAGRLGFLKDVDLPEVGLVSLWRIDGRILCTGMCPHQKRSLGPGEIEDGVVTCPAHGSRFVLTTGERVRGPADFDLTCYGAYEQNGRVWVLPKR